MRLINLFCKHLLVIYILLGFSASFYAQDSKINSGYAEVQELKNPNQGPDEIEKFEQKSKKKKDYSGFREKETKGFDWSKVVYGSNLGMTFRFEGFSITVSPNIGYRVFDFMTVGTGMNVQYYYFTFDNIRYTLGYVGPQLFTRFYIFRNIALFTQPEINFRFGSEKNISTGASAPLEDKWIPTLLTGITLAATNFGLSFSLGYDLLQHELSPYPGLYIGLSVGFY